MGETEKIKPATLLVSHLGFHRPPFGCSLCNLSKHLQGNHNRIISPHREGTTEAASRSDSWSTCTAPPPWCPRPLRPLRPGAAFSRSPDPFTVPGPRRRGAPAAGPSPCAAETPTLGVPARCGDARRVSHRRPGDRGHCGGLGTRGLDAVGAPLHRGQGTGWIGGAAESFKVPQVRPRVARAAPPGTT